MKYVVALAPARDAFVFWASCDEPNLPSKASVANRIRYKMPHRCRSEQESWSQNARMSNCWSRGHFVTNSLVDVFVFWASRDEASFQIKAGGATWDRHRMPRRRRREQESWSQNGRVTNSWSRGHVVTNCRVQACIF